MTGEIKKIERERKTPITVRLRDPIPRPSMDDGLLEFQFRSISEALYQIEEATRYLTTREKRKARREALRKSRVGLLIGFYRLFGVSKRAVLRGLVASPSYRNMFHVTVTSRGEL